MPNREPRRDGQPRRDLRIANDPVEPPARPPRRRRVRPGGRRSSSAPCGPTAGPMRRGSASPGTTATGTSSAGPRPARCATSRRTRLHHLRSLPGIHPVFEGRGPARRRRADARGGRRGYREGCWPVPVEGDAFTAPCSALSSGPPRWHLFRLTAHTVFVVAAAEPHGAMLALLRARGAARRGGRADHHDHLTERAAAA
jgi:hypothetical protein